MSGHDRPTILVVGGGERMQKALEVALERHELMVETAATESIVEAAFAAAPDLLLMIGDATHDGGIAALSRLSGHPAAALVPVVLLLDPGAPTQNVGAFRHGVVATLHKTASADGMARRIAAIARELPERSGEVAGELGEATVDELVKLFSQQLRSGILSVSTGGQGGPSTQVVVRAGRPVADAIEELVERIRPLVRRQAGPLRYEFHESPEARLSLFDEEEAADGSEGALEGRRVLLIEQNPARADQLVQELRDRGAHVVVADGDGTGLSRARSHDPDVVILDGSGVESWAFDALRKLRRDPRLRWASLLVVDAKELWPRSKGPPSLARLERSVASLMKPDRDVAQRARDKKLFETRLELVGPGRLLRALAATELGLKVTTRHPRVKIEIDLAEGLVAGARAFNARGDKELAEGPAAISAWLGLGSGRVRIEHKDAPATANIMSPVDDALAAAVLEKPPIRPSLPPPSPTSLVPPAMASSGGDADQLLGRLEALLGQLKAVLPPAEAPGAGGRLPPISRIPSIAPDEILEDTDLQLTEHLHGSRTERPDATEQVPPPWDPSDDDDIPVIEATAEPGGLSGQPIAHRASLPPPPGDDLTEQVPTPQQIMASAPPPAPRRRASWLLAVGGALGLAVLGTGGAGLYYVLREDPPPPTIVHMPTNDAPDAGVIAAPEPEAPDAGPAAPMDAGPAPLDGSADMDASLAEAGLDDAGLDTGLADAGPPDGGAPDAGPPDAGPPDAGPEPAEEVDAGDSRPPDVRYHLRSGNYARNQGRLQEAHDHYIEVLRIQPRNARALAGLARVAIAQRDGTQAVRWARRLASRNPNNQVLLGDAYRVAGNMQSARAAWRRALELHPGHRNATQRLGGN